MHSFSHTLSPTFTHTHTLHHTCCRDNMHLFPQLWGNQGGSRRVVKQQKWLFSSKHVWVQTEARAATRCPLVYSLTTPTKKDIWSKRLSTDSPKMHAHRQLTWASGWGGFHQTTIQPRLNCLHLSIHQSFLSNHWMAFGCFKQTSRQVLLGADPIKFILLRWLTLHFKYINNIQLN